MAAIVFTGVVPLTTCIQGNKTNIFLVEEMPMSILG
jgi:hypothetical protein